MELRHAQAADAAVVFEWRNDPVTRAVSLSTDELDWETHKQWFSRALEDPRLVLYLAEQPGEPQLIGMCRFDIDDSTATAEVSINLNPQVRGLRLSQPLLNGAISKFVQDHTNLRQLTARIRTENQASRLIFQRAEFAYSTTADGVDVFNRSTVAE